MLGAFPSFYCTSRTVTLLRQQLDFPQTLFCHCSRRPDKSHVLDRYDRYDGFDKAERSSIALRYDRGHLTYFPNALLGYGSMLTRLHASN